MYRHMEDQVWTNWSKGRLSVSWSRHLETSRCTLMTSPALCLPAYQPSIPTGRPLHVLLFMIDGTEEVSIVSTGVEQDHEPLFIFFLLSVSGFFFKGSVEWSRHERHFCSLLPYFSLSWLQIFQHCLSFWTSSFDMVLFKKFLQEKEKNPKNLPKRLSS